MAAGLPLSTLLSHVLVAFTIELDNEFERHMPHRTTNHGSLGSCDAPWLVSHVMWQNCMRFIDKDGVPVARLEHLARTPTNLPGMERWCYITTDWAAAGSIPAPRFGQDALRTMRGVLERLVGEPTLDASPLSPGVKPYPDGWRASIRRPDTLPHHPMVLHRGGFPDGS